MNYNNGFQLLAYVLGGLAIFISIPTYIEEDISRKLFVPATMGALALIFGFLAVIGAGKP